MSNYHENPFASNHSLDANPFDDPTDNRTAQTTSKQVDLERRERELAAREAEISRRETNIKHGKNNFPPFFPLVFHSISDEIPEHSRPLITRIFQLWLVLCLTLIINMVACIFILTSGGSDGGKDLAASISYVPVISVLSFLLWYRPIYNGYMKEQSLYYCSAGLINTVASFSRGGSGIVAGVLGIIATVGWTLQGVGNGWYYREIWTHHHDAGHSLSKAKGELAQHGAKAHVCRWNTPPAPQAEAAGHIDQTHSAPPAPQMYPPHIPPAAVGGAAVPQTASLYVGELDHTVSEAMLFEIFNMIGPVASIRVCRDAVTRRSLGYAYVNYLNAADGERALDQLNYSIIKNRPCRIMWSQRDPALRKTGQGNIFIKNLDEAIDNKALHDTFAAFGNVLSCKVATDETGKSRGYGYVHYETAESAEAAIKAVNRMLLNDKQVFVGHHISRKERQSQIDEARAQFTNIYVKNLDTDITEAEFRVMFEEFGNITSAVLQTDNEGKSRGFGFVNYENHEEAERAVNEMHEKEIKGKVLFVGRAQKKSERQSELARSHEAAKQERQNKYAGVNLYVKNLDDDVDDDKLRAEFEAFGTITSCKVMRNERDISKGFGFVCFSTPDEATKAVTEMNNKMIGTKPLYVSLAQRRDVRRQQLEGQIMQRNQMRMQQAPMMGPGYMQPQMYYGPGPGGYPPQAGRGVMGYPQPGMMPPRGRYPPGQPMQAMPVPVPYNSGTPQGYPSQNYNRGAPPNGSQGPPRSNGTNAPPQPPANAAPRPVGGALSAAAPGANGSRPATATPVAPAAPGAPAGGIPANRPPPAGAPAAGRPPAATATPRNPSARPAGQAASTPTPESTSALTSQALAAASPMEQKQMLGEMIYLQIYQSEPELAGKITGMLLEMDNAELLHLIGTPNAMQEKLDEAKTVLKDFSTGNPAE
ncbi:RNA recognition motif protein [Rhizoctonia solani]|uniref:RNA recognition motif protein n=1 Tax=Rhizoctonia solani TaxID=456999 RepID=A0A8H8T344_9AGAM|nr:RNA recognition motif protein [Rhizoctonia solani]QRW27494.1 RNA recognition motif protein [Rhizoctonia solani]